MLEKPESRIILQMDLDVVENKENSFEDSHISIEFETHNFENEKRDSFYIYLDNKLMSKFQYG